MNYRKLSLGLLLASLSVTSFVSASDYPQAMANWVSSFRGQYRANAPYRLANARSQYQNALAAFERQVSARPDAAFFSNYFGDKLRSVVATLDLPAAQGTYALLFLNHEGMESPQVAQLREAAREMRDATEFATLADGPARYDATLNEIARLIPVYEAGQRSVDRLALGDQISWLARGQQAPALVAELRKRYRAGNFVGQVGAHTLLRSLGNKPVDKVQQVEKRKPNSITHSHVEVHGQTYVRFVPSATSAEVEIGMNGNQTIHAVTTGGERGVSVRVENQAYNQIQVTKRLSVKNVSKQGLTMHPAQVSVCPLKGGSTAVQSKVHAVFPNFLPRLKIIKNIKRNVGYNEALGQVPAGLAEARATTAEEISREANKPLDLPTDMEAGMVELQTMAKEFGEYIQKRNGVYPQAEGLATDAAYLFANHTRANEDELGATTPPPAFRLPQVDAGVRMHESEVSNQINRPFSRWWMPDIELQKFNASVLNYVPAALRVGTHAPRWQVRFLEKHPFAIDFNDDNATIDVRFEGARIEAFDEQPAVEFKTPFVIRTAYRVQVGDNKPMLKRLQAAQLTALDPSQTLDPSFVEFFAPKADAFFKEELHADGLTPISAGAFDLFTKFQFKEVRTQAGWLLIGGTIDGDLMQILKKGTTSLDKN